MIRIWRSCRRLRRRHVCTSCCSLAPTAFAPTALAHPTFAPAAAGLVDAQAPTAPKDAAWLDQPLATYLNGAGLSHLRVPLHDEDGEKCAAGSASLW